MNTAAAWMVKRIKKSNVRILPLILLSCLLITLIYVFKEINSARISLPFLWIVLLAVVFNSLLIKTRWSMVGILVYNLPVALFFCVELFGKVFFTFPTVSLTTWLTESNLLIFMWLERLNFWAWNLLQGTLIQDTFAWPVFLLLQVWLAAAWLWLTYHKRISIWWGVMILTGMIGFWVQHQGLSASFLVFSLFIGFSLVAVAYYQKQQNFWETTSLDYSAELWMEWALSAILIVFLVVSAARTAPLVTTAEGWQRINEWGDKMRPRDDTNPVGTGPIQTDTQNELAENALQPQRDLQPPNVSLVGTPIEQGDETVMRVRVSGTTPFHWRSEIYSTYTGQGWLEEPLNPNMTPPQEPPPGYRLLRQEFMLNGGYKGRLFAAGDPNTAITEEISIHGVGNNTGGLQDGASFLLLGDKNHYQVTAWVPDLLKVEEISTGHPMPEAISSTYLQLPDSLPNRVVRLAERLVPDPNDSFTAAVNVQNYLREAVPYDLNTPPPPPGRDVVDYFLFEAPSGFCSYYASAMVVLLRSQGIPARVVTGYANGEFDPQTQFYRVPASNAHAWVEVFFAGYGWLPFEPTPSQNRPVPTGMELQDSETEQELTPQQWLNRRRWFNTLIGLLVLGLISLVTWGVIHFLQHKKSYTRTASHPAAVYYGQLLFRLRVAGVSFPTGLTPREFLSTNRPLAENYQHLWAGLTYATALYEQAVYSPHQPNRQEVRRLQSLMRLSLPDWWRLWLRYGFLVFRRSIQTWVQRRVG